MLQLHEDMEPLGPSLRRSRRRDHPLARAAWALVLSLGFNLLLWLLVDSKFLGMLPKGELRPVDLAPLSASSWEANRAIAPPRASAPAVPVPVPQPKEKGQIVDLGPAQPGDEQVEPPADAKYLSERNSRVEKETRARDQGRFEKTLPRPTVVVRPGGEGGKGERSVPGRTGTKGEKASADRLAMASPAPQPAPSSGPAAGDFPGGELRLAEPMAPSPAPGGGGDGGERLRGRLDPRLTTSQETLARLSGGPAPEYLGDLEEGSGTFLNSRQWRYTTYFTGIIRPALYANWKAEEAYLQRDPEGTMFPARKWITYLEVVLDDRGYLKSAKVIRPSGLDFLDRAAMDAFRGGSPFLNPPSGLVENGEIRFAQGFVVDMTGLVDYLRHPRRR